MGLPELVLKDPSNTPKLNVHEMFKQEQAKAFEILRKRLRDFYRNEVSRFRLEQLQAMAGKEAEAYRIANNAIRKTFLTWADERAPVFLDLSLVAGFPDPNPTSQPTTKSLRPIEQNRLKTAQALRTQLQKIDAKFYMQCSTILSAVLDQSSTEQANLETKIENFTSELDRKAELEARAQIRSAASLLQFKLSDPAPIYLTESPKRTIPVATIPAVEPAPRVPSLESITTSAELKRSVEQEARIWAALNRYDLVQSPKQARDATKEFQQWRHQHGRGP